MQGSSLKSGELKEHVDTEEEFWSLINYVLEGKSKKSNSYKFAFLKAICSQVEFAKKCESGYFISYLMLFSSFAESYWLQVNKYRLKQMPGDSFSRIETIIKEIAVAGGISRENDFSELPQQIKDTVVKRAFTECNQNVVGALYADFDAKIYSFDLKGEGIYLESNAYKYFKQNRIRINNKTVEAWINYISKINKDVPGQVVRLQVNHLMLAEDSLPNDNLEEEETMGKKAVIIETEDTNLTSNVSSELDLMSLAQELAKLSEKESKTRTSGPKKNNRRVSISGKRSNLHADNVVFRDESKSININPEDSFTQINASIKSLAMLNNIQYWGDIGLVRSDIDLMIAKIATAIDRGMDLKLLFKQYPYAMVSYVVFLAKYEYNGDFWGIVCDSVGAKKLNGQEQIQVGKAILKVFDDFGLDYTAVQDSSKKYVDAVLYEIGEPPESNLGDLFYFFKYGLMSDVDPQILINEIMLREYRVHKPLLHFLEYFPEEKTVSFILDLQDTYLSATQSMDMSGKYASAYVEWSEQDKEKSIYKNRKDEEQVEVRPFFSFEEGKRGLCIVLPRQNMLEEWIESANWLICDNDETICEINANVQGSEGKRFVDQIVVAVRPCKSYKISFEYNDGFEKYSKQYDLIGIEQGGFLYFDNNGRRINHKYLKSPYGIILYPADYVIESDDVGRDYQAYPKLGIDYRVEQIAPLGIKSRYVIRTGVEDILLQMRPQVDITMSGRKLFGTDYLYSDIPIFTEIPDLHISFDGFSSAEGIELRIEKTILVVEDFAVDLENIVDISDGIDSHNYGIHSVKLYQYGRFIKQVRFCILPDFESTYNPDISWPSSLTNSRSFNLTVRKKDDWSLSFENAVVQDFSDKYVITAPYSEGVLRGTVSSQQDNLRLNMNFELPICALKEEIISTKDINERCDLAEFLEGNLWLSLLLFGKYAEHNYDLELISVNGVEQKKHVKLSSKGAANFDLSVFRDTIQVVPMPIKILLRDVDTEQSLGVMVVNELAKFKGRAGYKEKTNAVAVWGEDAVEDLILEKYGDGAFKKELSFNSSTMNDKGWRLFKLNDGSFLEPGYYRLVRKADASDLFLGEEEFYITLDTDQFFYSSRVKNGDIDNFSGWLEQFITDLIKNKRKKSIPNLMESQSLSMRNEIGKYKKDELSDSDILNLTILGSMLETKISNDHKNIICDTMLRISMFVLSNTDRYRIAKKIAELNADQFVVDWCIKNYALLLLERPYNTTIDEAKDLANRVKSYSMELSFVILMRTNAPLRETIGDPVFRDYIGQEAILSMLQTEEDIEQRKESIKYFFRGEASDEVCVCIPESISGKNQFFEMIDQKRSKNGRVFLDKNKIPESGDYFMGSRYNDLFVNWYIRNNPGGGELKASIDMAMKQTFSSFKAGVWNRIHELENDDNLGVFLKDYLKVLSNRAPGEISVFTFPAYFLFEGVASLLTQMEETIIDASIKDEANWFMINAFKIAPYMSKRDFFMATLYVYLKKQEG